MPTWNQSLHLPYPLRSILLDHDPDLARPSYRNVLEFVDFHLGYDMQRDTAVDYYRNLEKLNLVADGLKHAFLHLPQDNEAEVKNLRKEQICTFTVTRKEAGGLRIKLVSVLDPEATEDVDEIIGRATEGGQRGGQARYASTRLRPIDLTRKRI